MSGARSFSLRSAGATSLAELVITSVKVEGRTQSEAARDDKNSRFWVHQLLRRFEAEGEAAYRRATAALELPRVSEWAAAGHSTRWGSAIRHRGTCRLTNRAHDSDLRHLRSAHADGTPRDGFAVLHGPTRGTVVVLRHVRVHPKLPTGNGDRESAVASESMRFVDTFADHVQRSRVDGKGGPRCRTAPRGNTATNGAAPHSLAGRSTARPIGRRAVGQHCCDGESSRGDNHAACPHVHRPPHGCHSLTISQASTRLAAIGPCLRQIAATRNAAVQGRAVRHPLTRGSSSIGGVGTGALAGQR